MKYLKNLFFIITSYILSINLVFWAWSDIIQKWLNNSDESKLITNNTWWKMLDNILKYIKDSLNGLLMITVVWVFLYLWIKLVLARWNPEEFKKTMMHFVYVAIWIFTVSVAYAIVKMVSWINLF